MEIQLFQPHPVIGYTFIPNLRTRIEHEGGGYLVRTNSKGFRSEHEYGPERSKDRFRILLFGDSFTAGDGVSNKFRYGDLLEQLIPNMEVYNFALPGTGTDQHYLVWQEIAKDFEHDLVLIAVQVENIRRVASRYRISVAASGEEVVYAKPYFELSNGELVLHGVPVAKQAISPDDIEETERRFVDQGGRMPRLRKFVNKLGGPLKETAQRISGYQPLPEYDDPENAEWKLLQAILDKWIQEIASPVIIMPLPLYHYIEETASPKAFQKRFSELSHRSSMKLHDPLADYYSVDRSERRAFRFEKDIHPTPEHHKLLAESLAKALIPLVNRPVKEAVGQ